MAIIKRRSSRWLITLAGVLAATAGWSTLLWPPIKTFYAKQNATFWGTVGELLKPVNTIYNDGIFIGWLFILTSIILAVALPLTLARLLSRILRYVESSEVDVSLLELSLTVRFDDNMASSTSVREQVFHANRPGLTAYHYNQTAESPKGRIDPTTFEMTSIVNGERITDDFIVRSQPKSFEAIEIFKRPLPTNFFATYLPDWLVLMLWNHSKIFDKVVVERGGQIVLHDEHNYEDATMSLMSLKRVAKRVTLTLDFPQEFAPRQEDMRCFVIRDNIVSSLYPRCRSEGTRRIYSAFLAELDHATLRFQWNNRRLRDQSSRVPLDASSAIPVAEPASSKSWWRRLMNRLPSPA